MIYISAGETAKKWGITKRRVSVYCVEDRIPGAYRMGNVWAIPENAEKPIDPRKERKLEREQENKEK